jgi:hypothetical protein
MAWFHAHSCPGTGCGSQWPVASLSTCCRRGGRFNNQSEGRGGRGEGGVKTNWFNSICTCFRSLRTHAPQCGTSCQVLIVLNYARMRAVRRSHSDFSCSIFLCFPRPRSKPALKSPFCPSLTKPVTRNAGGVPTSSLLHPLFTPPPTLHSSLPLLTLGLLPQQHVFRQAESQKSTPLSILPPLPHPSPPPPGTTTPSAHPLP